MYVRTYSIKLCKIHKKSNDHRHVINFMSKCTGMIEGLDLWQKNHQKTLKCKLLLQVAY